MYLFTICPVKLMSGLIRGHTRVNSLAMKNNLPYERAIYTLARSGSKGTTYDSNNKGEAYRAHLEDSDGGIVLVIAAAVERILEENLGKEKVNSHHDDFPHFPKELKS